MTDTATPWYFKGTLRTAVPQSAQLQVLRLEYTTKTKLRGLSPHANYTDRAAAAGR